MSDLLDRLRKAARSAQEAEDRGHFSAAGKPVSCLHCSGTEFDEGKVLLNTTVLTLLDLDWADRKATILSCRACGRIEWFSRSPERLQQDRPSE